MNPSTIVCSAAQKEALWRERLAQQRASGKTIAAYCQEHHIGKSTLSYWRRRLKAAKGKQGRKVSTVTAPFVELSALKTVRPAVWSSRQGAPDEMAGGLEVHLELGGGVVLHIARR